MARDEFVDREKIADHLDVEPRTITNLVKEHADFPSRVKGRARTFPKRACLAWYIKYKQEEAVKRTAPKRDEREALDVAKTRKVEVDTELAEIELDEARGRIIPVDLHEARVAELCDRLAARCKGLGRYVGDVQRAVTELEAVTLLNRITDELLASLRATADEVQDHDDSDTDRDSAVAA